MSLATRCTACGTVFRVVQDQLKVSEGWVRCGRCSEVFNALEGLFDLGRDALPEGPAAGPPTAAPGLYGAAADMESAAAPVAAGPSLVDKIDAQLMGSRDGEHGSTPAISARDRLEFPDAQFDPDMGEDDDAIPLPTGPSSLEGAGTGAEPAEQTAAPEFLRQAQREARRRSPRMRALQAVALVVLTALLGLQAIHHQRDIVAARWPAALPALAAWCGVASCAIEAPRRIEDVSVESTALTRAAPGSDAFRLSVGLRNRGTTLVAQPSVDLSLTDVNGQLIARRMLGAREFRVSSATIGPGAETMLQLVLTAGAARVSGYTVEIFYP